MGDVLQFGIPSLDEMFGKLDVALVELEDICPPAQFSGDAGTITRERGASLRIWWAEWWAGLPQLPAGQRVRSVFGPVHKKLMQLSPPDGASGESLEALALQSIEVLRETLNELLSEELPLVETDVLIKHAAKHPESETLRHRIQQFEERRGARPRGKDLRLLNRMRLELLFFGLLAPARHPMEGYGITIESRRHPSDAPHTTSLCLLGPGGTGKSVLALHLASRYAADTLGKARVLYASTDLSTEKAQKIWKSFALDSPNRRVIPFRDERPPRWEQNEIEVELVACDVLNSQAPNSVSRYLEHPEKLLGDRNRSSAPGASVGFLDLASTTTGDDWGFICRVVADTPAPDYPQSAHLLIVDAIEGLEALVGEQDAFGETRSRRSRVAQLLQAAEGRFHVIVIIEERGVDDDLPEEYITDAVVRVRTDVERGYSRRTLSIVKVRGQEHIRGEHRFVVRSGEGSTTGRYQNADDPDLLHPTLPTVKQSYFHVYHSLHYQTREVMRRPARQGEIEELETGLTEERTGFNITHLDGMLGRTKRPQMRLNQAVQTEGLPPGSLTVLIGDDGAHKSRLGRAWLSGCFTSARECWGIPVLITMHDFHARSLAGRLVRHLPPDWRFPAQERNGIEAVLTAPGRISEAPWMSSVAAANLLNTTPPEELRTELRTKLSRAPDGPDPQHVEDALLQPFVSRAICRRLEIHDVGSSVLMHIVRSSVEEAKRRLTCHQMRRALLGRVSNFKDLLSNVDRLLPVGCDAEIVKVRNWLEQLPGLLDSLIERENHREALKITHALRRGIERGGIIAELIFPLLDSLTAALEDAFLQAGRRHPDAHRIRLVIEDWSTIKSAYPEVASDPLFLPYLTFYLHREGISVLLIDTQPGAPASLIRDESDRELRSLAEHHLYAWHVPFFGERRVAITALPPVSDEIPVLVRELRAARNEDNERLEVDPHFELYLGLDEGNPRPVPLEVRLHAETPDSTAHIRDMSELFDRLFHPVKPGGSVVTCETAQSYEKLRDFCYLQRDTRMDHTLVFQVDEFWSQQQSHLHTQAFYLNADTKDRSNDPLNVFRSSKRGSERRHFFIENRSDYTDDDFRRATQEAQARACIDRVPYTWDFGLLLLRRRAWDEAGKQPLQYLGWREGRSRAQVHHVWQRLRKPEEDHSLRSLTAPGAETPPGRNRTPEVEWGPFLEACVLVAREQARLHQHPLCAFDVDLHGLESISSLVLEIWASEMRGFTARICEELNLPPDPIGDPVLFPPKRLAGAVSSPTQRPSLIELLGNRTARWCLFRAWLLLGEATSPEQFASHRFEFVPREARPEAVAVRHWYSTASHAAAQRGPDDPLIPSALPGAYTTRGDWFLALAGGSRSPRLGAQAVDLMSSRRANIARLQQGLGLPTRELADEAYFCELPSALITYDGHGHPRPVMYQELRDLGAAEVTQTMLPGSYSWLWRSSLRDYDRHTRVWTKWLCWVRAHWDRWLIRAAKHNGFSIYALSRVDPDQENWEDKARSYPVQDSWKQFEIACEYLILNLKGIG